MNNSTLSIGVSSCLLGNKVRYDGLDELNLYIKDTLQQQFQLKAICPEVELGMGIPREIIKLYGDVQQPNLIAPISEIDWTDKMMVFARQRVGQDNIRSLSGFIFKSKSPSCGIKSVKLYQNDGYWERIGTGLFAQALIRQHPSMPVIEDSELSDEQARDQFIKNVIEYHRSTF